MEAGKFIKDLLYQADLVRLPGLGTFVSTYLNARTDFAGRKISPPAKSFQFDDSRKEDDDLMWSWISEQEGISESEARMIVSDFVADVNHELQQGREVAIDGLGTFFADVTGKKEFHFSVENNFNAESIGFSELDIPVPGKESIHIHSENEVKPVEEIKKVFKPEPEIPVKQVKPNLHPPAPPEPQHFKTESIVHVKKSRKGIWIAIILLLVVAGIAYLAYEQRAKIGEITQNWFSKHKTTRTDTLTSKPKADTGLDKTLAEQAKMKKALDVQSIDSNNVFIPYGKRQLKFYIVAASFTNYEHALKLKDELRGKGFDSEIVTVTHKYYKVTMGSFSEKQQALLELEKLKTITRNNSLWLLHI